MNAITQMTPVGIGAEWSPQWLLSAEQKALQADLIALCETTLRPNAIESDKKYIYPRKNFEALAAMGLMSLTIPKELGGRGESHLCAAMVVETIARYGCPSTAMCYTMHLGACAAALLRHHDNERLKDILRRVDKDVLIGTLSYSDPETGSHFWYPMSSRAERTDGGWKVFKKASWTTSGGFADWYIIQTTSPDFGGDYSDLSCFLVTKDQIKADPPTGTASACAATSPARSRWMASRSPRTRWSARWATAPSPTTKWSTLLPGVLLGLLERHLPGRHGHHQEPHHPQGAQRRGHARGRLPDHPGLRGRVPDRHQRQPQLRVPGRQGPRRPDQQLRLVRPPRSPTCRAPASSTGCGRSSSSPPRTSPSWWTRCSTPAAAPATSRPWASSACSATARPAG
jgi:hypothetical protein